MKILKILLLIGIFLISMSLTSCTSSKEMINGKIVFQSDQDGNYDLYIMNLDSSDQQNLTNSPPSITSTNNNFNPVPSPNGKQVAFESDRDGNHEIYIIDLDSKVQINLTRNKANDYSPTWSPDGKSIAFISDRDAVLVNTDRDIWTNNIYLIGLDGFNLRRLTPNNVTSAYGSLAWSPDGKKLAFDLSASTPHGGYFSRGINLMTLDDLSLMVFISEPYNMNCCAQWSPNGQRIVYSVLGEKSENIHIMDVTKTNQVALTKELFYYNTDPSWSPDGEYIVFSSNRDGKYHIYTMKADGTNLKRLTNGPYEETNPVWLATP